MCISHGQIAASENDFQALVQLTTGGNSLVAIPTLT